MIIVVSTSMRLLISPSHSHRLGCAIAGYQGDEPGDMSVLQRREVTMSQRSKAAAFTQTTKNLFKKSAAKSDPYYDADR